MRKLSGADGINTEFLLTKGCISFIKNAMQTLEIENRSENFYMINLGGMSNELDKYKK